MYAIGHILLFCKLIIFHMKFRLSLSLTNLDHIINMQLL